MPNSSRKADHDPQRGNDQVARTDEGRTENSREIAGMEADFADAAAFRAAHEGVRDFPVRFSDSFTRDGS
jgi:hypothetical protein